MVIHLVQYHFIYVGFKFFHSFTFLRTLLQPFIRISSIVNKHTSINSNSYLIQINMQFFLTLVLAAAVACVSEASIPLNARSNVSADKMQIRRPERQSD